MKTTVKAIVAISMSAGLAVSAQALRADQMAMVVSGPELSPATVRAEALERQAKEMFSIPKEYGKAAKLLQQAAAEREAGDPERIHDLYLAARLSFYVGQQWKALALMTQAADEALSVGDVIGAAHQYVDAAFLAQEARQNAEAIDLAKKAIMLAQSPLINGTERDAILSRVQA